MNASFFPSGVVGRADLLRMLAVAPCERLTLDVGADAWFGYVRQEPQSEPSLPDFIGKALPLERESDSEVRLPLRMPFIHAVVERVNRSASVPDDESEKKFVAPIAEGDAEPPSPHYVSRYTNLLPQARLLPALHRFLGATRYGGIDVEQLVRHLAAGSLPRHLPRRPLRRWHPELVVVLDFRIGLWPYVNDMHQLAKWLLAQCGASGVSLRIFGHGPAGEWKDWPTAQKGHDQPLPWRMPAAGSPVLLVSDLGLLHGAESDICRGWTQFVKSLLRAQARPFALVPLGAEQVDGNLARLLPILRWSQDACMHAVAPHGVGQSQPAGLDELLALVAVTRRIDPPLLRALRQLNGIAPLNAGLEGALWCHPDVEGRYGVQIRDAARDRYIKRFESLAPQLQERADELRRVHHGHLRAVLNHEETLLWYTHIQAACRTRAAMKRFDTATAFMDKLLATLSQPGSLTEEHQWWQVAQDIVARADQAMQQKVKVLDALVIRLAEARRLPSRLPDWANTAQIEANLGEGSSHPAWLVRDVARGAVMLQLDPPGDRQYPLGDALTIGPTGVRLENGEVETRVAIDALQRNPIAVLQLDDSGEARIETGREILTVATLRRPRGAAGWACLPGGVEITSPSLCGQQVTWLPAMLRPVMVVAANSWALEANTEKSSKLGPHGALNFGIDAVHGVWAELTVVTKTRRATQRLRWIEPGEFWMGSPPDEPERDDDEGPRHRVTLTQGFWLADSACTQALWLAVMGENPSRFKGDEALPVEGVSWNDVQEFLKQLEVLLPGCKADLPSEAEWEYACRAGSETPFSFGAQISPEQVNYDGNFPYAGGKKGLYRGTTVAVKSLPPNGWGLYEMHGNVWEWCADGRRNYTDEAQQNPRGAEDAGASRALRGSSWDFIAWRARSAYRYAYAPGFASRDWGFRLALRSNPSSLARSGGAEGEQEGVKGSPRDEAGLSSAKRLKNFFKKK